MNQSDTNVTEDSVPKNENATTDVQVKKKQKKNKEKNEKVKPNADSKGIFKSFFSIFKSSSSKNKVKKESSRNSILKISSKTNQQEDETTATNTNEEKEKFALAINLPLYLTNELKAITVEFEASSEKVDQEEPISQILKLINASEDYECLTFCGNVNIPSSLEPSNLTSMPLILLNLEQNYIMRPMVDVDSLNYVVIEEALRNQHQIRINLILETQISSKFIEIKRNNLMPTTLEYNFITSNDIKKFDCKQPIQASDSKKRFGSKKNKNVKNIHKELEGTSIEESILKIIKTHSSSSVISFIWPNDSTFTKLLKIQIIAPSNSPNPYPLEIPSNWSIKIRYDSKEIMPTAYLENKTSLSSKNSKKHKQPIFTNPIKHNQEDYSTVDQSYRNKKFIKRKQNLPYYRDTTLELLENAKTKLLTFIENENSGKKENLLKDETEFNNIENIFTTNDNYDFKNKSNNEHFNCFDLDNFAPSVVDDNFNNCFNIFLHFGQKPSTKEYNGRNSDVNLDNTQKIENYANLDLIDFTEPVRSNSCKITEILDFNSEKEDLKINIVPTNLDTLQNLYYAESENENFKPSETETASINKLTCSEKATPISSNEDEICYLMSAMKIGNNKDPFDSPLNTPEEIKLEDNFESKIFEAEANTNNALLEIVNLLKTNGQEYCTKNMAEELCVNDIGQPLKRNKSYDDYEIRFENLVAEFLNKTRSNQSEVEVNNDNNTDSLIPRSCNENVEIKENANVSKTLMAVASNKFEGDSVKMKSSHCSNTKLDNVNLKPDMQTANVSDATKDKPSEIAKKYSFDQINDKDLELTECPMKTDTETVPTETVIGEVAYSPPIIDDNCKNINLEVQEALRSSDISYKNIEKDIKNIISELLKETSNIKQNILNLGVTTENEPPFTVQNICMGEGVHANKSTQAQAKVKKRKFMTIPEYLEKLAEDRSRKAAECGASQESHFFYAKIPTTLLNNLLKMQSDVSAEITKALLKGHPVDRLAGHLNINLNLYNLYELNKRPDPGGVKNQNTSCSNSTDSKETLSVVMKSASKHSNKATIYSLHMKDSDTKLTDPINAVINENIAKDSKSQTPSVKNLNVNSKDAGKTDPEYENENAVMQKASKHFQLIQNSKTSLTASQSQPLHVIGNSSNVNIFLRQSSTAQDVHQLAKQENSDKIGKCPETAAEISKRVSFQDVVKDCFFEPSISRNECWSNTKKSYSTPSNIALVDFKMSYADEENYLDANSCGTSRGDDSLRAYGLFVTKSSESSASVNMSSSIGATGKTNCTETTRMDKPSIISKSAKSMSIVSDNFVQSSSDAKEEILQNDCLKLHQTESCHYLLNRSVSMYSTGKYTNSTLSMPFQNNFEDDSIFNCTDLSIDSVGINNSAPNVSELAAGVLKLKDLTKQALYEMKDLSKYFMENETEEHPTTFVPNPSNLSETLKQDSIHDINKRSSHTMHQEDN